MKLFLTLSLFYILLIFAYEYILVSDELIYYGFEDRLSHDRITKLLEEGKKWSWLGYALVWVILVLRLFFVAICISIGAIVTNVEVEFKKYLQIAINADFVLLMPIVFKLIWFSFIQNDYTIEDLQNYSNLSLYSLFNHTNVELWLLYPLQLVNLFELAYWCILAWQLKDILNRDFTGSFSFVASTYGVGLLLWVIFVMFLTVSLA